MDTFYIGLLETRYCLFEKDRKLIKTGNISRITKYLTWQSIEKVVTEMIKLIQRSHSFKRQIREEKLNNTKTTEKEDLIFFI